jgi:hypothetical protein
VDPQDFAEENVHSFNRYAYGNNNPYKFRDPDGQLPVLVAPLLWWMGAGAVVSGGLNAGFQALQHDSQSINWGGIGGVLDAAGDGVILGPVLGGAARLTAVPAVSGGSVGAKGVTLSRALHGEAAEHAADAIAAGKPSVLTIDRAGAAANRKASIGALEKVPGKHLDEYPPAMFKEGGASASARPISPRDNMSAGACIGNACRGLPDGTRIRINVGD